MDLKWLAEQLSRPGYSQAGLARALGKSPSAVSRILSGHRQIKLHEAAKITAYLGAKSPPVSDYDYYSYYAALGEAVATWNAIENALALLTSCLHPHASTRAHDTMISLYFAIRPREARLKAISEIVERRLFQNRKERDAWLSLSADLTRIGLRRDTYVRAITQSEVGRIYGEEWGPGDETVNREELIEDVDRFYDILQRVHEFSDRLKGFMLQHELTDPPDLTS